MDKLVVKTAVKTVLIILGIFLAVFAIFNFAFPQHMATAMESIGNYSLAVKYADLRYHYTKDVDDLARCFDDSVLWENDKYIVEYGDSLMAHKDFQDVCEAKNREYENYGADYDYATWVNTKVALSHYNIGFENNDDKDKAIGLDRAAEMCGTESFVQGNPLLAICARIRTNKDKSGAEYALSKLNGIHPEDSQQVSDLEFVKREMDGVIHGT